jgi:hypothetical protein
MVDPVRCSWDPRCAFDVVYGVSLRGDHYQSVSMEHALGVRLERHAHAVLLAGGQQLTDDLRSLGLEHAVAHERSAPSARSRWTWRAEMTAPARRGDRRAVCPDATLIRTRKAPTAPHFPG